ETLTLIAREGPGVLNGALGSAIADGIRKAGGIVSAADITDFATIERAPLRGPYRGYEVLLPPPPASSGVHVLQMLNILEGFDLRGMGFGSADTLHLLAEALKIAFADRAAATADPAFVDVPVARLISRAYGDERRAAIDMLRAQAWGPGVSPGESANTTHVTVADDQG
ncbi:MAG: gamma-glutamyltransferase, partial [bacterium]